MIVLTWDIKSKHFLERGHSPLPRPLPSGEGDTPSPHPTNSALRYSRLRRSTRAKHQKHFLGRGHSPLPRPSPLGRGTPPPHTLPPRRLDPRVCGARPRRLVGGGVSLLNSFRRQWWHLPLLQLSEGHIERVNSVKLLGINLDADFSWKSHVECNTSKATQRLFSKTTQAIGCAPGPVALFLYRGNQACTGICRPGLESLASDVASTRKDKYKYEYLYLSHSTSTQI